MPLSLPRAMKKGKGNSLRGSAFRMLALKDRSCRELRVALLKRGFAEAEVLNLVAEFEDKGYLDDEGLAERTVQYRLESGRTGPLRIRHELLERGVAAGTVERVVQQATKDVDLEEMALRLAVKKANARKATSQVKQRGRVGRFLLGRGFSPTTVDRVIARLFEEWAEPGPEF